MNEIELIEKEIKEDISFVLKKLALIKLNKKESINLITSFKIVGLIQRLEKISINLQCADIAIYKKKERDKNE